MRITPDLEGCRFGRLTVICKDYSKPTDHGRYWKCLCDCGQYCSVSTSALNCGNNRSCGCLHRDLIIKRNTKHGMSKTRLYHIYSTMISRCTNCNSRNYPRYGGRGIKVCGEWRYDFQAFYDWAMAHGYRDDLTIDRINNDGDYCPENCRWTNMTVQQNNRRTNHLVEYDGEMYSIADLARKFGLEYKYTYSCISNGFSIEDIISGNVSRRRSYKDLYEIDGREHRLMEWISLSPICASTIRTRLDRGWDLERALFEPSRGRGNVKKDIL